MTSKDVPLLDVMKVRNKLKENTTAKSKMVESEISSLISSLSLKNEKIVPSKDKPDNDVPSMAVTMVRNHLDQAKIAHSHFSNQFLQRFVDAHDDNPKLTGEHVKSR